MPLDFSERAIRALRAFLADREQALFFLLAAAAAVCFTVGGIFMKLSEGLSRLAPALGVGLLFLAGAGLQTLAMNRSDLAVTYLVVLGLEAVLAFTFGVVIFGEACSPARIAGVALVAAGIASLRFSG